MDWIGALDHAAVLAREVRANQVIGLATLGIFLIRIIPKAGEVYDKFFSAHLPSAKNRAVSFSQIVSVDRALFFVCLLVFYEIVQEIFRFGLLADSPRGYYFFADLILQLLLSVMIAREVFRARSDLRSRWKEVDHEKYAKFRRYLASQLELRGLSRSEVYGAPIAALLVNYGPLVTIIADNIVRARPMTEGIVI